jgi:ADP-heptose:LPS heptosyltransferase
VRPEISSAIRPGRLLIFLRLFLAPFALGATTVLGFAPFEFYFVPPVTLTALLLIWLRCHTFRAAVAVGFAFGAGLFLVGVSWVYVSLHVYGGMAMPVAAFFTLLFCLIQACYPALACAILQRLRANTPVRLMLLFPALLARLSGTPFRATVWHEGLRPRLDRWYTHRQFDPPVVHERRAITEYFLSLLPCAGVPIVSRQIRLVPREDDREFSAELLRQRFSGAVPARDQLLLVHPGSRSPYRLWPAERFAEVCRRAQAELGVGVLLLAGPGEEPLLRRIAAQAGPGPAIVDLPLTVPQLAALAASAGLLLCHDSGPMHVAAAVGTRVVALLGSQNPVLFAPAGSGHVALQPPLPCTTCVAPGECVPGDSYRNFCVRNLTVAQVFAAVRDQLARPALRP